MKKICLKLTVIIILAIAPISGMEKATRLAKNASKKVKYSKLGAVASTQGYYNLPRYKSPFQGRYAQSRAFSGINPSQGNGEGYNFEGMKGMGAADGLNKPTNSFARAYFTQAENESRRNRDDQGESIPWWKKWWAKVFGGGVTAAGAILYVHSREGKDGDVQCNRSKDAPVLRCLFQPSKNLTAIYKGSSVYYLTSKDIGENFLMQQDARLSDGTITNDIGTFTLEDKAEIRSSALKDMVIKLLDMHDSSFFAHSTWSGVHINEMRVRNRATLDGCKLNNVAIGLLDMQKGSGLNSSTFSNIRVTEMRLNDFDGNHIAIENSVLGNIKTIGFNRFDATFNNVEFRGKGKFNKTFFVRTTFTNCWADEDSELVFENCEFYDVDFNNSFVHPLNPSPNVKFINCAFDEGCKGVKNLKNAIIGSKELSAN